MNDQWVTVSGGKSIWKRVDWFTIVLYLLLILVGWLTVCGASYSFENTDFFDFSTRAGKQFVWICCSFGIAFVLMMLDDDLYDKSIVYATIELKVTPQRDCGFDDIAKTIMMYDEVESVSLMSSGAYDLAVEVKGSNLKDVAFFVSERLATIDGILSTSTHFILKKYKEKGIFIDDEEPDERGLG